MTSDAMTGIAVVVGAEVAVGAAVAVVVATTLVSVSCAISTTGVSVGVGGASSFPRLHPPSSQAIIAPAEIFKTLRRDNIVSPPRISRKSKVKSSRGEISIMFANR